MMRKPKLKPIRFNNIVQGRKFALEHLVYILDKNHSKVI